MPLQQTMHSKGYYVFILSMPLSHCMARCPVPMADSSTDQAWSTLKHSIV